MIDWTHGYNVGFFDGAVTASVIWVLLIAAYWYGRHVAGDKL